MKKAYSVCGIAALAMGVLVVSASIARAQVLIKDTKPGFAGTANHRFVDYYNAGGSDIAGKTGTASAGDTGLNSSAWFIGFTPNITASVATFDPKSSSAPRAG